MPTEAKPTTKSWCVIVALLTIISTAQASDIRVPQAPDNPAVTVERDPALITPKPSTDTITASTAVSTAEPTQYCSVISGCVESK
jgi:hypothetical protein